MSLGKNRFLFYAPNVHTGGGLVLLQNLLEIWPEKLPLVAWFDARAKSKLTLPANAQVDWVKPSFGSRLKAEIKLAMEASSLDRVFCFHGLPPLLRTKGKLLIFQQNRNRLGLVPLRSFDWRTRQRLRVEEAIAYVLRRRCTSYWVQTPSMARELQKWYGEEQLNINILPFTKAICPGSDVTPRQWEFIYVAEGLAHKNHRCLVEAWSILASQGIKPKLVLTLSDRDATLRTWISQKISAHGLDIFDLGHLPHEKVLQLYGQSKALVFPSLSESFGLPLIEAQQLGLPILASELDYVRDVCVPVQTFDPHSAVSIARAVRRFLSQDEPPLLPQGPKDFISALLKSNNEN